MTGQQKENSYRKYDHTNLVHDFLFLDTLLNLENPAD